VKILAAVVILGLVLVLFSLGARSRSEARHRLEEARVESDVRELILLDNRCEIANELATETARLIGKRPVDAEDLAAVARSRKRLLETATGRPEIVKPWIAASLRFCERALDAGETAGDNLAASHRREIDGVRGQLQVDWPAAYDKGRSAAEAEIQRAAADHRMAE